MTAWSCENIPSQQGKTFLITGANSGTGFAAAVALAQRGAHVIMACRDPGRGEAALAQVRTQAPEAGVELQLVDLADLASVRSLATALKGRPLDGLLNNAGVMAVPRRLTTKQGHELQMGVNHLGHFALTHLLLDNLLKRANARIVTVSSNAHRGAQLAWLADLQSNQRYERWRAYMLSKLCNLLFAFELQRRLAAQHHSAISLAAHPGTALTQLQHTGPNLGGGGMQARLLALGYRLVAQSAAQGALPLLYALVAPGLQGGEYVGPAGLFGMRGAPVLTRAKGAARDLEAARSLWEVSSALLMAAGIPVSVMI